MKRKRTDGSLTLEHTSRSPEETVALGERLGRLLRPGHFVALVGHLGSGKTYFAKGLAKGLGVQDERVVTSPSFVLMNIHEGRVPVLHVDAYRLRSAQEFRDLDIEWAGLRNGVVIVEWADRVWDALPDEMLLVRFLARGFDTRHVRVESRGARMELVLKRLNAHCS